MKTLRVLSILSVLLLVGTGTTMVTAEPAGAQTAISQAGDSSVYFIDIAATDTHGTGNLMINLKQQKFVFNGKGFDPDKHYALYYQMAGTGGLRVFASAVATPSGNLHLEGKWVKSGLPSTGNFGVLEGDTTPIPLPPISNITKVIDNKNNLIKTGDDIAAGKLTSGGFSGSGAVFALANMAIQSYRYNTIMDELNSMDEKVDELLTDMGAVQNELASIESILTGLENWIQGEAALGTHVMDAQTWIEDFYSNPALPKSYNWGRWLLAGCDVNASTCDNTVTDASLDTYNNNYITNPTLDPPDLATDNFPLWWAYSVNGAADLTPFAVNGNSAETIVSQIHRGMVPQTTSDTNGLLSYMEYVFSLSACGTNSDVTACNLYTDVYGPLESYFQEVITNQITLAQAIVESYAELASFYQTDPNHSSNAHVWDSAASDYMTDFQQKLSEEAESFIEVAEQIALYRAADSRLDWSTFGTSDAAQLLARADFLAARLVGSATGKPWAWLPGGAGPGVTGRIFYAEQQTMPSTTVHEGCLSGSCTTLTEVVPMPQDFACKTSNSYPGQCLLTGDWPYLQWSAPDSSNVVSGTPTFTWKLRRLTQQQMAEGTYQVAGVNTQYGNANLVVSEYGDDYSNPPADGTTPVLFGSFNNVEGSLGVGALLANRTYSGGSDDNVHDFTVSPLNKDTQMNVAFKSYTHTGPTISTDWYERIKIKLTAVSGSFSRVRVLWPNTVAISLGSKYAGECCDTYYQSMYQKLELLNSSGSVVSGVSLTLPNSCGTGKFKSCSYSSTDPNGITMLASSPVVLTANQTYTLQAHYYDKIQYYCGSVYCYCDQFPSSGSHVTWDLVNPTVLLVK